MIETQIQANDMKIHAEMVRAYVLSLVYQAVCCLCVPSTRDRKEKERDERVRKHGGERCVKRRSRRTQKKKVGAGESKREEKKRRKKEKKSRGTARY